MERERARNPQEYLAASEMSWLREVGSSASTGHFLLWLLGIPDKPGSSDGSLSVSSLLTVVRVHVNGEVTS